MALELYLEVAIITLLSLYAIRFDNMTYVASFIVTSIGLVFILGLLLWIPIFTIRNFGKISVKGT